MMFRIKKIIFFLVISILFTFSIQVYAASTYVYVEVNNLLATYASNGNLTITGDIGDSDEALIIIQIINPNDELLYFGTIKTNDTGEFTSTVTIGNILAGKYTIKAADYNGGPYASTNFTLFGVSYNLNGGTGKIPTAAVLAANQNFTVASTSNIKAPTDKAFKEWNTNIKGTGTSYKPGDIVKIGSSNITLYAIWKDVEVTQVTTNTTNYVENTILDESNILQVTGSLSSDATLTVTPIIETEEEHGNMKLQIDDDDEVIGVYEVKLNGDFEGVLTLSFIVDSKYNGKQATIVHKKANGSFETYTATVTNGKVTIEVEELSPFIITIKEEKDDEDNNQIPSVDDKDGEVKTTSKINISKILYIAIPFIIISVIVIWIIKRKRI